jgi:hypothetical protein
MQIAYSVHYKDIWSKVRKPHGPDLELFTFNIRTL